MRTLGLVVCLLSPLAASAQESPRAIIDRGIAAHGGQENLTAARSERLKFKGVLQVGTRSLPFTSEMVLQLPGQYRSSITITDIAKTHQLIHLLDGERGAMLVDGQPQTVSPAHLSQLKQTMQLERALRLVPLVNDPAFTLSSLPEIRYNGHVYQGVRVQAANQRELKLYFDRSSGLLVKTEYLLDGPDGKEILQEAFYGDYRDVAGCLRAGKILIYRDGKKVMETELLEARRVDRIDPNEFRLP